MAQTLNNSYGELVQKAQYLFWIQGYKGVSTQELAKHLEVSTSTIYNKYSKEMLFIDSLENYTISLSDPVLNEIRNSKKGMESFKDFFYMLIDALLNKSFPKSCLIVNTIVELRNEQNRVSEIYEQYFTNMTNSYKIVLKRADKLGEIKYPKKIDQYAEFLLGVIFGLSILYKIKPKQELQKYIDDQLSLIE